MLGLRIQVWISLTGTLLHLQGKHLHQLPSLSQSDQLQEGWEERGVATDLGHNTLLRRDPSSWGKGSEQPGVSVVQLPALHIPAGLVQQLILPLLSASSAHSCWQSLLASPASCSQGQPAFHPQALSWEAALPNTHQPGFCRVTPKTTFLR